MEVSWSPLSYEEARGYIIHYTIYYKSASSEQSSFNHTNLQLTSVVIGDLLPEETYVVQVSASTAVGEGEKSEEVSVKVMQSSGE